MAAADSRQHLLSGNEQFRRLAQEHTQYAQRLEALTNLRFLSEEEKIEEVRLKKLKLRLKDEMERIEAEFRRNHQVA